MRHLYGDEVITIRCGNCGRCSPMRQRILSGIVAKVVRAHPRLPNCYEVSVPNSLKYLGTVVCPRENLNPKLGEDYTPESVEVPAKSEPAPVGTVTQPQFPDSKDYGYGQACGDPSCRAMMNEDHTTRCDRTGTFRLDK